MNQKIEIQFPNGIELYIKREDLLHPLISGNKFRKLKYNIKEAVLKNCNTLITFGGAFSNHIVAVAAAGKENGLKTIGIIRGDELFDQTNTNPSLSLAKQLGMEFEFLSRTEYRNKEDVAFVDDLKKRHGNNIYIIPEGERMDLQLKVVEKFCRMRMLFLIIFVCQ